MEKKEVILPAYLKLAQVTMGIVAFFYVLYIGQDIIVPLVFATILAILLNPVVNFFCNKGVNRVLSILFSLIIAIILIGGLFYFIGSQLSVFSDSFPLFKQRFAALSADIINWVSQTFNISKAKINNWILKMEKEGSGNSTAMIGQTLNSVSGVLVLVLLLPVYIFMILFYKALLLEFIAQLFADDKHGIVIEVLTETKKLVQSYLVGLLLEAAIVAALNSIGLMIIGVQYAILIGIIGALLNIIPYIGGLIAIAIPMALAIMTISPIAALWVLVAYLIVQFIDNNIIVPRVVASKVKINALVSIVVVLIGGALWGVSGMFLSIPLTAILKVIFDRVESLKPFGFLIGDNQPEIGENIFKVNKPKRKRKPVSEKE